MQLINQTHLNRDATSTERAWQLLAVVSSQVRPTGHLLPFMLSYVTLAEHGQLGHLIAQRLMTTTTTAPRYRPMPPCWLEHGLTRQQPGHAQQLRLALTVMEPGGRQGHMCPVDTWSTVEELTRRALKQV